MGSHMSWVDSNETAEKALINPYLAQIHSTLPRILSGFDVDPTSPLRGCGDRRRWAWKLADFANGTPQGIAHGLAYLVRDCLLPSWLPSASAIRRIDECFIGAEAIRRGNGSWEEAFPHEASFCVTALVTHDLLCAIQLVGDRVPNATRNRWVNTVRPGIKFLLTSDERHALISNHLATAAAALAKWTAITAEPGADRGRELWKRILSNQSVEGWFREYEGADPGYLSLCLHYLADLHGTRSDWDMSRPLTQACGFMALAVHPDGSFGGLYGSRNTRFWFPSGIELFADSNPTAAAIASTLRNSIHSHRVVRLDTMDDGNLGPMFNSYCWAASIVARRAKEPTQTLLPCQGTQLKRWHLPEAGLDIDSGPEHYTIVNWRKGGTVQHYPKDGSPATIDGGVALPYRGRWVSTQTWQSEARREMTDTTLTVIAPFVVMHREWPSPLQMIILRLLALTAMRWRRLSDMVKILLVRRLITGRITVPIVNRRVISLGPHIKIEDHFSGVVVQSPSMVKGTNFSSIHMASQGYWQVQDETPRSVVPS